MNKACNEMTDKNTALTVEKQQKSMNNTNCMDETRIETLKQMSQFTKTD